VTTYEPTPKHAAIDVATSGDNVVVPKVDGRSIRVVSYTVVAAGAVTAQWMSSTAGPLSGAMALGANSVVSAAYVPLGHVQTIPGEPLNLKLGGSVGVRGHLTYVEIPAPGV
jgi:hypothetical protein